jgi:hypothetical protein
MRLSPLSSFTRPMADDQRPVSPFLTRRLRCIFRARRPCRSLINSIQAADWRNQHAPFLTMLFCKNLMYFTCSGFIKETSDPKDEEVRYWYRTVLSSLIQQNNSCTPAGSLCGPSIEDAFARCVVCIPHAASSSPNDSIHRCTRREHWRVERCGDP